MSELKQGRCRTKQRREQPKQRSRFFQQNAINSTIEDFYLLNKRFFM
jgi:hypothetical protein